MSFSHTPLVRFGTPPLVREAQLIHRATKEPEVYLLKKVGCRKQRMVNDWVRSPLTEMELRATTSGKLAIRKPGDDTSRVESPA